MSSRFNRLNALFLVTAMLIPEAWRAGSIDAEVYDGSQAAANQVLVKFRDAVTPSFRAYLAMEADADRVEPVGGTGAFVIHSRTLNVSQLLVLAPLLAKVVYAEPDYIVHAQTTPNDPDFPVQWALQNTGQSWNGQVGTPGDDIHAVSAWGLTTGSTQFVVGVVDTGVDYTHQDLAANIWSAPKGFTVTIGGAQVNCAQGTHGFNAIKNTCDPADDNGHGTHVSGTIGAVGNNSVGVAGVNWSARIMGLKFLDSRGNGSTSNAVNAIEFAVQTAGALGSSANVVVLSNSWGGSAFSQTLADEISRAQSVNMLIVAAAMNNATDNDTSPFYPANLAGVMAVAATDNQDHLASFSDYGLRTVALGAPGVGILSTVPGNAYEYMNGTSMATPHVSGTALLVRSLCALPAVGLAAEIADTVDADSSLWGRVSTGGRLDAYAAVHSCTLGTSGSASVSVHWKPDGGQYDDQGQILIYIGNVLVAYEQYDDLVDTALTVAQRLAYSINSGAGHAFLNASAARGTDYNASFVVTAIAKGPATNFPSTVLLQDGGCPDCPHFAVSPSGSFSFAGGHN